MWMDIYIYFFFSMIGCPLSLVFANLSMDFNAATLALIIAVSDCIAIFGVEIPYPRKRTTRAFVKYNWRFSKLESPSHTVTPKSSIVGYCCTMLYLYPMKYTNYKLLYVLLCIIPPLHPHENPWFDILGQKKLLDHIPSKISPLTSSTYTMKSPFSMVK